MLCMASADVLPYDYENYGKEILVYIDTASYKSKIASAINRHLLGSARSRPSPQDQALKCCKNSERWPEHGPYEVKLREAERALLSQKACQTGPGTVIPFMRQGSTLVMRRWDSGINEAIDRGDRAEPNSNCSIGSGIE